MRDTGSVLAIAVASLMAPMAAWAQTTAPAAAPQEEVVGIQDIVVTAQRVEESSQRAAVAVDVVSAEDLAKQSVTRAEDLTRTVPSLVVFNSGGPLTNFYLRGVGNNANNGYVDGAIAFAYDGVFIGRPAGTSGMFYDLERVEVLKGPQGTLYGRNATAGAINVLPAKPKLGHTGGNFQASYGNYDAILLQGGVNVALGTKSALRLSGNFAKRDGYWNDGTGDQDEWGVRLQLASELTENLTLRLSGDYAHQGGLGSAATFEGAVNYDPVTHLYSFQFTGFAPNEGVISPASNALLQSRFLSQAGRFAEPLNGTPFNNSKFYGAHAEIIWNTDAGTLTILPAYRKSEIDTNFLLGQFRAARNIGGARQTSIEARWNGELGERVQYIIGGMYFDELTKSDGDYYNQLYLTAYNPYNNKSKSTAVFGRVTAEVADGLKLNAGGRFTSDRKRFNGQSDVYILFCGNPAPPQDSCPTLPLLPNLANPADLVAFYAARGVPTSPVPLFALPPAAGGSQTAPFLLKASIPINSSLENEKFTYRLAAQYDISPTSMIYASYETGYHSGGFSFARGLETFQPETIGAFTVGSKNRFLDNRLQVNFEGFVWKYDNQQYSQFGFDLGNPPSTVFVTRNIGKSTIKGFELEIEARPARNTMLSTSIQYVDARYDSFVYYEPNQGLPPKTACPFQPTTQNGQAVFAIDCSGKPAKNAPKWTIFANAGQVIPLGENELSLQVGGRYRSKAYLGDSYYEFSTTKGNFVADASATYGSPEGSWYITAYINNIGDSRRKTLSSISTAGSMIYASYEPPRTYGLRVGGKF